MGHEPIGRALYSHSLTVGAVTIGQVGKRAEVVHFEVQS